MSDAYLVGCLLATAVSFSLFAWAYFGFKP